MLNRPKYAQTPIYYFPVRPFPQCIPSSFIIQPSYRIPRSRSTALSPRKLLKHVPSSSLHRLSLGQVTTLSTRLHCHPSRYASRSKVRVSAQAAKDVADIVGRDNTFPKATIPILQNLFDDFDPGDVNIVDGDVEPILRPVCQVAECANIWRWPVEVGAFW